MIEIAVIHLIGLQCISDFNQCINTVEPNGLLKLNVTGKKSFNHFLQFFFCILLCKLILPFYIHLSLLTNEIN